MAVAVNNRLRKFWSSFIPMYLFSLLVSVCVGVSVVSVYGKGFGFLLFLVKDMFGLASEFFSSPTLCGAWWYLGAAICCYVLAPLFYMVISRGKLANCILLLIAYMPWLVYFIVGDPNMHTDREFFYIFAFVLGMTACKRGLFVKFLECRNIYKYPLACIVLLGLGVTRFKLNLMVDSFIAFCLILLMTQIAREDSLLGRFFKYLGESSGNIYMFHVSILGVFGSVPFVNHWVEIIFTLFLCLSVNAMLVEIRRNLLQLMHS
ncbi:acyltransferase family protein [Collinsella bouchesdurhonensis]|uniref:acyltransferase family protein n=1 Tax=Collinsella bouchesdurhonensis TaxID=1907654 RepID=UPI001105D595|nr:acyltransferase family protein [Collinsella bouchesdurhonensis]